MKLTEVGIVFLIGVTIGMFIPTFRGHSRGSPRVTEHPKAFFLGITIKFHTIDDKEAFKAIFTPFAQFVAKNEPGTISYELSESDKDPTQVFLTERYNSKKEYLDIHRKTPEFVAFRAKMTDLGATYTMDGHSYIESNIGFI